MGDVLGVQVGEGIDGLPEDAELVIVSESLADQVGVETLSLDRTGYYGEPLHGGLNILSNNYRKLRE